MQEFIHGLFDFSFKKFITPKVAKVVYALAIAGAAVQALMLLRFGPFGIIAAPVFFFVTVVAARVFLEVSLAVFQIARYTAEIARRGRGDREVEEESSAPVPPPPPGRGRNNDPF